jgi:NAD(P)-dependent dehydrogenase (short-subunit alcohol dehydrogenase family)
MTAGNAEPIRRRAKKLPRRFRWDAWRPREKLPARLLFLCTPLAGFISGEVLNVNGGAVLVG